MLPMLPYRQVKMPLCARLSPPPKRTSPGMVLLLAPYSIDYFDTLSHLFATHFAGSHPREATPLSFLNVRQEKDEMLRAFIDRFRKAALRMPNLTQEMILQCMALTLKPSPFTDNIYLRPPASMHELKLRVADYIRMEEMKTLRTKFCTDYTPSVPKIDKTPSRSYSRPKEPRPPQFSRYVPLSVPWSRLLNEALQADLIPPPRKTLNPPNADMTKYCKYHRNNGHTTYECKALQDTIEELIRIGHLRRFLKCIL